jgi:hypothetical protein
MRDALLLALATCALTITVSCGDPGTDEASWYATCGDPACEGYAGPIEGLATCADDGAAEGDACSELDATCDLEDDCNRRLVCVTEDPTGGGDCPVSLKRYKRDIRYLEPTDRAAASQDLLAMRLATWRYQGALDDGAPHLGFLIDDEPGSPAVQADGQHVDLYGYVSLAVATIQEQQDQLAAQRARIAALEQRLQQLESSSSDE